MAVVWFFAKRISETHACFMLLNGLKDKIISVFFGIFIIDGSCRVFHKDLSETHTFCYNINVIWMLLIGFSNKSGV